MLGSGLVFPVCPTCLPPSGLAWTLVWPRGCGGATAPPLPPGGKLLDLTPPRGRSHLRRTMYARRVGPGGQICVSRSVLRAPRCCHLAGMMTRLSLNADRGPFAPPPHLTGRETEAREWGTSPREGFEAGLPESSTYASQHDVAPPHRWGVRSRGWVLPWVGAWRGGPGPHPSYSTICAPHSLPPHAACPSVALGVPSLGSVMHRGDQRTETVRCTKWRGG